LLVDEADLTLVLRDHASRHSVPGAALGILHDGAVTTASYGVADVTSGEPITPGTRFAAGSLTKSMVATAIARLAGAGRLSLDDPVVEHVPELRESVWAAGVTLRDLMANRGGLPLRADLEFGFGRRSQVDDDALARLTADIPRDVARSSVWSYSNVGWCVVGRAMETATGATWEDVMRRQLLDAEGMSETSFAVGPGSTARVSGHDTTAAGLVPVEPLASRAYGPAGGTAVTTVADLMRFASLHLDDPSLAELRVVHSDLSIYGWLDSWCLGWARFDWGDAPVWGWDGVVSGERSVLRLVPEQRAAVMLMTNGDTGRAVYRSLFAELMESTVGIGVPPLRLERSQCAADDLSRFAGVYGWPDRRVEVTPTASGGLVLASEGEEAEALPLDDRAFVVDRADPDNPTVTFGGFDADGRPGALYQMLWALPRLDR
jgi:CubicO group peptidase (beta-lactamase class C family)